MMILSMAGPREVSRGTGTNVDAYELIMSVAAGHLDTVDEIATRLRTATEARSWRIAPERPVRGIVPDVPPAVDALGTLAP